MILKTINEENFNHYKKPSMVLGFPSCNWKCEKECGKQVCQNSTLAKSPNININKHDLCVKYLNNNITNAIVCAGLEPLDSFNELYSFINILRNEYKCNDDFVIYTGYTREECNSNKLIEKLCGFDNIIIKFGRYIPNQKPHYDDILGINLASDNQYAEKIS